MRDDEKSELEKPELNITDNTHEAEPLPDVESPLTPTVDVEAEPSSQAQTVVVKDMPKMSAKDKFVAFFKTKKGKVVAIIVGILLVVGVLLAIPASRYGILGSFIKKDVSLTVLDSVSKKPVSGATVTLGTYTATSDAKGVAKLGAVPVGNYTLNVTKKYYASSSAPYLVPVIAAPSDVKPNMKATGRTVTMTATNKITGAGVSGATITVSGASATTDDKGVAEVILPVQSAAQKGTVRVEGYNDGAFEVTVTNADDQKVALSVIPSGKIFFLSKRTGKIDVMKSDLDGTNAEVVTAGTGRETDASTVLLSTTDWKYLALQASRDSEKPKLYLVEASTGKLTIMDEGDAEFQLVGWTGRQFIYKVTRNTTNYWDDKRVALKGFNAESAKQTTLDETQGSGTNYNDYAGQNIDNLFVIDQTVVYTKTWDVGQFAPAADRKSSIVSVSPTGTNKKSVKEFSYSELAYAESRLYEPAEVYFRVVARTDNKVTYYEYEDGKVTATADTNDQKFYNSFYATYLVSPTGNKTLWYEARDGKNVIFVGDKSANNGREVGVTEYIPYGWYTDDYLLFSKNGSELYILAEDGKIDAAHQPLKVTDYHKPQLNYPGYGGGYGGQ